MPTLKNIEIIHDDDLFKIFQNIKNIVNIGIEIRNF